MPVIELEPYGPVVPQIKCVGQPILAGRYLKVDSNIQLITYNMLVQLS